MDHLTFAMERGEGLAHDILLSSVTEVIDRLGPETMDRLAVCGNPIQLSLFEGIGIRDLAFAGENKIRNEGIVRLDRRGHIVPGGDLGFREGVEVIIPPAVKHEIGADALAMMLKSGFLDSDMCMVTDYGTNAEMALKVGDDIFTGSAAAGPAMEGQEISCGMLAGPGAICDLVRHPAGWRSMVLDETLTPVEGPSINLRSRIATKDGVVPCGITGTGVVALIHAGMEDGAISSARIRDGEIRFTRRVRFTDEDLKEAGKAIGAIRAGHMTLMVEAGVRPEDVRTMYMAGASGTYVDPEKARRIGMVVPMADHIVQVGNTSLELAKDLANDPRVLDELNDLRDRLVTRHTMFAASPVFSDLYTYEIGYWSDGMPLDRYRRVLENYSLDGYLDPQPGSIVERGCGRDIHDIGAGLDIIDPTIGMHASWDCCGCMTCVNGCPGRALSFEDGSFSIRTGLCLGTACSRCESVCPQGRFRNSAFGMGRTG